jgi:hypothetical protein
MELEVRTLESLVVACISMYAAGEARPQITNRVSLDSAGVQGDRRSAWDVMPGSIPSRDGRFVAFHSDATNLVAGDTNHAADAFVHDGLTGVTERVSVDGAGNEGNSSSHVCDASQDGRFVIFMSNANDLVPGDNNIASDVFVRDRQLGTTERISVDSSGNEGDRNSLGGSVSSDGRYVAFWSYAYNLVVGDTNTHPDVFVRDRQLGTTELVSVDSSGIQANQESRVADISPDGRYVVFWSFASNLVTGDTNGEFDVFVRDRSAGVTERVSVDSTGFQANDYSSFGQISADGRYIAFGSDADNLVAGDTNSAGDVFVRDRQSGTTERASIASSGSEGDSLSGLAGISADGRWVSFVSGATNLVSGDTNAKFDVFLHDRQTGTTTRVSVDSSGNESTGGGYGSMISSDGRFVSFTSRGADLVSGDTNGVDDAFIHGPDLTLEADPPSPLPGATLTFNTWTGAASGASLLVITDVDGAPMFVPAVFGSFDAGGVLTLAAVVPSGLSGHVISFTTYGFIPSGRVDRTNPFAVSFQ